MPVDDSDFSAPWSGYDDRYPSCDRTAATLRIFTGDTDPRFVGHSLGLEATTINVKGVGRVWPLPARSFPVGANAWFLDSEGKVSSADLRRHLDWLLDQIEPVGDNLIDIARSPNVVMDVFCPWWSARGEGGPRLNASHLRRLGALHLSVGFEIAFYPDTDQDPEDPI